ncbi:MAG TPA: DNA-binding protein [Candidatus Sulfotelmatobacter sp.]|nr:DNA-binding protein [Candidatus Sulfotelmatobacter sp.]
MQTRGRPGQVTYQQVEEAALKIASSGARPTLRSVQELLGAGSLALISRHLARWKTQRARSQASNPFTVGAGDVEALTPADFATLINHLVRLEVRQHEIPGVPDTTCRNSDADGGIDGMMVWSGGPARTARLPARSVIWQSKSGRRLGPSDLVREIMRRDGTAIKPRIRDVLAADGAYIVFSGIDMTADQKLARTHAMVAAARPHLPGTDPKIYIMAADEIAAWAAQDLWSRTFLIRAAGREHTALLATFDEWSRLPGLDNPYVWDDVTGRIAEQLRAAAKKIGGVFRLNGASGLGKTRLALEALRPMAAEGVGIVYFDARYPGSGLQLLSTIPDWRRLGVGGTIVVDDCEAELHQQLAQAIAGSALSVISIDHRHELSGDATLRQTNSETITRIVKGLEPQLTGPNFLRIVEYAQGWPLMAILVLKAISNDSVMITDLTNDQITQRLIGYFDDSDEYAVLSLLALFDHVGYSERVALEWEILRATFLPNVSRDAFHRIVKNFERKGLIVAIGRYWRVTPPPLALRLTRRWLDDVAPETRERLFAELPDSLTIALARRFGDVTTGTSLELAAGLLSPSGRFGNLAGILGPTNSRMLRSLAQVNPDAAIKAMTRALSALSDEDLSDIDEPSGRQNLVWALEGIAFHAAHFKAAVRLIFALARNENASNANNATGTLSKFFAVQGSQTEAHPNERIAIVDEMLERTDSRSHTLVAEALGRVLSLNQNYVVLGVESQGGRPILIEWCPTIWKDIFDYVRAAVDRALTLSSRGPQAFALSRDVIADGIPLLARYRLWDDLERAATSLAGPAWPKAVDRLKWAIRHVCENDADRERARGILQSLLPTDLLEQITLYVTDPPLDLDEVPGSGIVDRSLENVDRFARETTEAGRVRAVLDVVSTGWSHRLPHGYGQAAAKHTGDREQLVEDALAAYVDAPEPRNDLALMSIVGTLGEADPDYRWSVLVRISKDDHLVQALPAVIVWPRVESRDIELLLQAYKERRLTAPPRRNLFMGNAYAHVDREQLRALAAVFLDHGWYSSVVNLLMFGVSDREGLDDVFEAVIVQSGFLKKPLDDVHEWSLLEVAKRLIKSNVRFATDVGEQLMTEALSDKGGFAERRRVADLWPMLLAHDTVWDRFKRRYASLDRADRWRLLIATQHDSFSLADDRLAVEGRSIDDLIAFGHDYVDDVPAFLAQYGLMIQSSPDEPLRITPLMMALLENFGERDDVLRSLEANIHSFASVGPGADYYAMRMALVDGMPTFGSPRIEIWKDELRSHLDAERKRASLRDNEIEQGIF